MPGTSSAKPRFALLAGHDAIPADAKTPQLFFTSEQTLLSSGRKASSAGIVATSL